MKEDEIQQRAKETWDGTSGDDLFFSLMQPKGEKKERECIKCHEPFMSPHSGKRFCVKCGGAKRSRVNADFFIRGEGKWN